MPLAAIDVDGTLMRSDNTLSPRNAAAIAAAREAGWLVVLATGKPPWAVAQVARRLGLEGPHVVANGSALWRPEGPVELLGRIHARDVHAALAFGAAHAIPRATSGPRGVFCEAGWNPAAVAAALADVGEEPPTLVADAVAAEPDPWKVILILRSGTPHAAPPALTSARWVRTHRNFFEALPRGASKGSALRELCRRLGVDRRAVAAFGDGENDVEMLRWAGRGIAMAQAAPEALEAADAVTATNDEDGVAVELERLLASGWGRAAG
jgi:HAD superfamily hydrolase (TIGR01484 family)